MAETYLFAVTEDDLEIVYNENKTDDALEWGRIGAQAREEIKRKARKELVVWAWGSLYGCGEVLEDVVGEHLKTNAPILKGDGERCRRNTQPE